MKALIFDLDGTLVDTVYAHTLAWQRVFAAAGLAVPAYVIHSRIGLNGKLFVRSALREIGKRVTEDESAELRRRHGEAYAEILPERTPLPGAVEILRSLRQMQVPHAVATSGKPTSIKESLAALEFEEETAVVDASHVTHGKPNPETFLTAAKKIDIAPEDCLIVGDAIWDVLAAQRAGMLCVAVLTGGNDRMELIQAGAHRVFRDVGELHANLDQFGFDLEDEPEL
ncbi:HAD family hydrolase [Thalassoroseus pseudoceratinae]|uniref:HAD family hydrolase n=1 Tax=Thalassoroseus pseudoceratinae TaxID=2713176 RepID=UPI001423C938|nr:HAD family phosphatase [Thalassoroseus pseudoceratinae]